LLRSKPEVNGGWTEDVWMKDAQITSFQGSLTGMIADENQSTRRQRSLEISRDIAVDFADDQVEMSLERR
jgi:hypothetical protein